MAFIALPVSPGIVAHHDFFQRLRYLAAQDSGPGSHPDTDPHADTHGHTNSNGDSDSDSDTHPNAHAYTNSGSWPGYPLRHQR